MAGELHLLFSDESLIDRDSGFKFRVTAGIVLKEAQIDSLCTVLAGERRRIGLQPSEPLKFSHHNRPKRIEEKDWTEAKRIVLEAMASTGVALLSHIVLENIASTRAPEWAMDALVTMFDRLLECDGGCGIVVADHWAYGREDLAEVAAGTVGIYDSRAPHVMGVSTAHVEAMLPLQLADLAVGALRFCLGRPAFDVSRTLFGYLSAMIWPGFSTSDPPHSWYSGGLELRPSHVQVQRYDNEYKQLKADIDSLCTGAA